MKIPKIIGIFSPVVLSALAGSLTIVAAVTVSWLLLHFGLHGKQLILDDLLAGIIVAVLIYGYEHRRSRDLNAKLATIKLMNHHIRNALQVIVYSVAPAAGKSAKPAQQISESVARIDWALREILTGRALQGQNSELGFADRKNVVSERDPVKVQRGA